MIIFRRPSAAAGNIKLPRQTKARHRDSPPSAARAPLRPRQPAAAAAVVGTIAGAILRPTPSPQRRGRNAAPNQASSQCAACVARACGAAGFAAVHPGSRRRLRPGGRVRESGRPRLQAVPSFRVDTDFESGRTQSEVAQYRAAFESEAACIAQCARRAAAARAAQSSGPPLEVRQWRARWPTRGEAWRRSRHPAAGLSTSFSAPESRLRRSTVTAICRPTWSAGAWRQVLAFYPRPVPARSPAGRTPVCRPDSSPQCTAVEP